MALTIFEDTFGKQRVRFAKVNKRHPSDDQRDYLVEATAAVQSVVDTFRDPNTGDRYVVGLSSRVEAFTRPGEKTITVSHLPLMDKTLKVSVACTIMTGLVFHEIGHTLFDIPNHEAIKAAFGDRGAYKGYGVRPFDQLAHTLMNIGADARLEAEMAATLPIARDIFPTMLHWLALRVDMVGKHWRWTGSEMRMADRVNFAGTSIRYPWTAVWSRDAATRDERAWWQDWGRRYVAITIGDTNAVIDLVYEGLARLRHPAASAPVEEPPITCGPMGPGGDEPPTEGPEGPTNPGSDFDDEPDEDDEDKPKDGYKPGIPDEEDGEDGEGGDESDDEDEDGEGGSGSDADALDDDESEDEDGEGNPGGSDPNGEDKDGDAPDGHIEMGGDHEDEPAPGEFKQDFDAHDLNGSIDALNHGNDGDWDANKQGTLVQTLLNEDKAIERVKSSEYGTARVATVDPLARLKALSRRY